MERIRQFLNKNIYIFSVRQGLLLTIPFLILGSFSMVIMQFPLRAWQELLPNLAGGSVKLLLMAIYQATFGSLSFIFALMISYSYGEDQTVYKNTHIFFPAVALCAFIAFSYPSGGVAIWGPEWSFTAICITLLSCFLLTGIYRWVEGFRHLYTMGVAYNFNASMQSLIPAVATIGLCGFAGLVLSLAFDDVNIMNFGSYLFLKLFGQMGNSLFSMLLYILLKPLVQLTL